MKMRKANNIDNVSLEVKPLPCVSLWSPAPATARGGFVWGVGGVSSFEVHYLSHPCHIQGNTLRRFDILAATEDGHNLQRHSTQAGGQAGIAEAKQ